MCKGIFYTFTRWALRGYAPRMQGSGARRFGGWTHLSNGSHPLGDRIRNRLQAESCGRYRRRSVDGLLGFWLIRRHLRWLCKLERLIHDQVGLLKFLLLNQHSDLLHYFL